MQIVILLRKPSLGVIISLNAHKNELRSYEKYVYYL